MLRRIVLIALALGLSTSALWAFPRKVLFEEFTNYDCGPCAGAAPAVESFIAENYDNLAIVITHVWWPGSEDPWYVATTPISNYRIAYYGVNGVPAGFIDGSACNVNYSPMTSAFNTEIQNESPLAMYVLAYPTDEDSLLHVAITVMSDSTGLNGNYKLRVAMCEIHRTYAAPNGQDEWFYGLLAMQPDAAGTDFSIDANSTDTYEFDFEVGDNDLENIVITAWVQNDITREVVQAAMERRAYDYDISTYTDVSTALVNPGEDASYSFDVLNTGINDDSYSIDVTGDLPDGWTFVYTTPEGEQTGNSSIDLASLEDYTVTLTVSTTPDQPAVGGTLTFTLTSTNDATVTSSIEFYTMSSGQVLVVNADPNSAYSDYYTDALEAAESRLAEPFTFSVWSYAGHLFPASDLAQVDDLSLLIVYLGDEGTISDADVAGIEDYLDGGGNVFITGSRAPALLAPTDLIGMMGATFQSSYSDGINVTGVEGDPISDGMEFAIEGGDGADNRGVPTALRLDGGVACLKYSVLRKAGVRNETDDYRTLLLGFPFEAIATEESRNELMLNSLVYLAGFDLSGVPAGEETNLLPRVFLGQNYPNPFNPATEISFSLPEPAKVEIVVFDLAGREVARLAAGDYAAGLHRVRWSAVDAASGVYFYRVKVNGEHTAFEQTRKMLLVK